MIFILKSLKSKTIITIFNETLNIIQNFESLINTINDFILLYYFKMFKIKKIINKNENIKT